MSEERITCANCKRSLPAGYFPAEIPNLETVLDLPWQVCLPCVLDHPRYALRLVDECRAEAESVERCAENADDPREQRDYAAALRAAADAYVAALGAVHGGDE